MSERVIAYVASLLVAIVVWGILVAKGAPDWAAFGLAFILLQVYRVGDRAGSR